ncbi:hypothetical protein ABH926_009151 [Catenulispora sp. GP43]|uniref:hypothetical protein n=1 Tax=Catenulispora sp. GP43 TaxID=3156263 RepID=UPI003514F11D
MPNQKYSSPSRDGSANTPPKPNSESAAQLMACHPTVDRGLNALSLIVGFVTLNAIQKTMAFDQCSAFTGCLQRSPIGATILSGALIAAGAALYRPGAARDLNPEPAD